MNIRLSKLFIQFVESEKASGVVLILATAVSVIIANSKFGPAFSGLWHSQVGLDIGALGSVRFSLEQWINDGLMSIFFLLIGLEIERELYVGELSNPKNAFLPIIAAFGGMVVPAFLHFVLNYKSATQSGAGIPMATDIAFALGVLALLGNRVSPSLRVFLAALAIIDDLGAIMVISFFYVGSFSVIPFSMAMLIFLGLLVLNRLGVKRLIFYLLPGLFMWFFMQKSGVHATITGVLLAFAIPFATGDEYSPSYKLQEFLHKPVALLILPVFALANTGIAFSEGWFSKLGTANVAGIFAGLFAGKPVGICLFSFLAVWLGWSRLPEDLCWRHIIGAGFLGGIGFTMSILITLLAFDQPSVIEGSKITIMIASLLSGITGFLILRLTGPSSA